MARRYIPVLGSRGDEKCFVIKLFILRKPRYMGATGCPLISVVAFSAGYSLIPVVIDPFLYRTLG
tara:strand:+ start:7322 stop:7516 length:195 start_codon:yes stop_codon:yes gene_type:complete